MLNLDPNDAAGDDDVADGRFQLIAQQIVGNLQAPDIIALQEVQDNSGSANDGTVSASLTLQMLVDAIAAALGVEVVVHPDARAILERYYETRGGLTEARLRMARVPDGAELIVNRVSGAPGIRHGNIFILAGVPHITAGMLDALTGTLEGGRPVVDRLVAAVDCGQVINPDLVRQQIEGGLIFGLAHALGGSTGFTRGLADARGFGELWLPRLADTPDITVELIRSGEAPGGVGEIAVPPVAPAIANALWAATGNRIRRLPLTG